MKRIVLAVLAVLLYPVCASALFMDILSQEHQISGYGHAGTKSFSFFESANSPLHHTIEMTSNEPGHEGSWVHLRADTIINIDESVVAIHAGVGSDDEQSANATGSAFLSIVFQPFIDSIEISGYLAGRSSAMFIADLNTGAETRWDGPDELLPTIIYLDKTHTYSATVELSKVGRFGDAAGMYLKPFLVSEPSTILILVFGLIGLGFLKKQSCN